MAKRKTKKEYTAFGKLSGEIILKNLPFVFFLGFLAMMYIANVHYAEKTIREIQEVQRDLKTLRRKYNSLKAENMYNSKQSEIVKEVSKKGLHISSRYPINIVDTDSE